MSRSLESRLQLFMLGDKDKEFEAAKKDGAAADRAESRRLNEAGDIDSHRLDTRQKVRNSLPSLLTVAYRRWLPVPSSRERERTLKPRKECRVPGNRPNISVYIYRGAMAQTSEKRHSSYSNIQR